METNEKRIDDLIKTLATFNDSPGNGITRFSFGEKDRLARKHLMDIIENLGLKVRIDSVGNIFARLEGSEPDLPVVMSGSHIDSVKNGGQFDGIVGVVGALEAIRVMVENNYKPRHSVELVIFSEEEGSNFQVPVLGSKVLVGELDVSDLKRIKNQKGESAFDVIKKAGYHPEDCKNHVLKKDYAKAMIEMHIEQSLRLDKEGHTIGIIQGIAGLKWIRVNLKGVPNHAGATPMHLRQDPMAAAACIISEIEEMAKSTGATTVATVGNIEVTPNIPNAIPAEVTFSVDIRDVHQERIDKVVNLVEEATKKYAAKNNVECQVSVIASSEVISIDRDLINVMERNAIKLGLDYIIMSSGAIHDSNYMAQVTKVGMIFVPSKNGRSHVKEEDTDIEDIKAGADLLLATLTELSK